MKEESIEFAAYIGLDWADRTHVIRLRCAGSQAVEQRAVTHTPEALAAWVSELQQRFGARPVAVAMEQWRGALVHAVMSYDFVALSPATPKSLAKYREASRVSGATAD